MTLRSWFRIVLSLAPALSCSGPAGTTPQALAEQARAAHRAATRSESIADFGRAQTLYGRYLGQVPDDYEMSFFHAELLFKVAERDPQPAHWERAAAEYQRVAELRPDGAHLREAAYGHVMATMNALGLDHEASDSGPLTPARSRLLGALQFYVDRVPDGDQRTVLQYRRARILYGAERWNEAAPLFAEIAVGDPDHELALYSANLLLDCLGMQHKVGELRSWVDRLQKSPLAKDEELASNLRGLAAALAQVR
jgi:tetratricopeptide (TPR) repeat protein